MTKHIHNWEVMVYSGEKKLILAAPNNIIMDFYNTIADENSLSSDKLIKYIIESIVSYLKANWQDKTTTRIVSRLRHEQDVAIKSGLKDLPRIPQTNDDALMLERRQSSTSLTKVKSGSSLRSSERSQSNKGHRIRPQEVIQKFVAEHVIWRIKNNHISQISALLMKWIVEDGLAKGDLKLKVYDDVPNQLSDWRQKKFIKLYTFGDLPGEDQKLCLTSTNHGNLTNSIANCVDGTNKKSNSHLLKRLANALRDKTMNIFYITHELNEAIASVEEPGAFRGAILINRSGKYSNFSGIQDFQVRIQPLMERGKLFICDTFDNIQFNPDPEGQSCC